MEQQMIIQRTLDYIEENLTAEVTAAELAEMSGYSLSHFGRIFKQQTGLTAAGYITRRRLIHAAYDIFCGRQVIDAALAYGFDTKAGFYKAFLREFGMPPLSYADTHILRPPYPIKLNQEEHVMLTKKQVEKLLSAHWGINEPVTDYYWSGTGIRADDVWNVGEHCYLKTNGNIPVAEKAAFLAEKVAGAGIPAEMPVHTLQGGLLAEEGNLGFVLYRKAGEPLLSKELIDSPELVLQAGRQTARLNRVLASLEGIDCPDMDLSAHLKDWAVPAVRAMGELDTGFWHWYLNELDTRLPHLPRQLIHRDPHSSNLLKNGGFRGFELAQKNVRLFDPCYTSTSILCETWDDPSARERWFDVLHRLIGAYDAENPLTAEEKAAVPFMVFSIQLICVACFSGVERLRDLAGINIGMLKFLADNREKLVL